MLLSLNLLKKYTPLEKNAEEIADRITLSLTEVEKLEKHGDDTVIEIENKALTHRPDCFSHLGIAREIAAYFNVKCEDSLRELSNKEIKPEEQKELKIAIENKDLCSRYCGVVLTNIQVGPSPDFIKQTLESIGIRSINNVVDITNYVMIELGQPLHAFDYDKVKGHEIKVRNARIGEKLTTLDGKERELTEEMLVIADQEKAIGLGGVMGGANTEVTEGTITIVLEAANFEAKNNRKTSKALNLRTDAATRYEKNLDPNMTRPAMIRAIELLKEHAGAKVASEIIDIHDSLITSKTLTVSAVWINRFLGTSFTSDEMSELLSRFGFSVQANDDEIHVTIPTYRSDLSMDADIAEEIARVYGYDNIPTSLPSQTDFTPKRNMDLYWRSRVRTLLMSMGFYENVTSPFVGMELIKKSTIEGEEHLKLRNPLSPDQEYMRRNLLPQLLETVKKNLPITDHMRFYEINKLFVPQGNDQPREPYYLTGIALGDDYQTVKGFVEALLDELGIKDYSFGKYPRRREERCAFFDNMFHPNKTAQIYNRNSETEIWGTIGYIHPTVTKNFGIDGDLVAFDIPMEMIVKHAVMTPAYKPISMYPPIIEDITIDTKDRELGPIIEKIKQQSYLITNVELIDTFETKHTLRLTFQDQNKNLTEAEISTIKEKIVASIA